MPEDKISPSPSAKRPNLLRHPGVVTALVAAVVAGLFSLLATLIKPEFWEGWSQVLGRRDFVEQATTPTEQNQNAGTPQVTTKFKFDAGPLSARLAEIRLALKYRVDSKPDIVTRRSAITALVTISSEQPAEFYYAQAVEMLVEYVKDNIDERRRPGEQVELYLASTSKPRYRPRDIIDALEGLREIRRASDERVKVVIGGIDFHQINLSKLDLEGFYFGHADFSDSILSDCHCRGADFQHALFLGTAIWGTLGPSKPADFRDTNFLKADLTRSKWANVDFTGSNIEKAIGHRGAWIADAHGLTEEQRALFPDGE